MHDLSAQVLPLSTAYCFCLRRQHWSLEWVSRPTRRSSQSSLIPKEMVCWHASWKNPDPFAAQHCFQSSVRAVRRLTVHTSARILCTTFSSLRKSQLSLSPLRQRCFDCERCAEPLIHRGGRSWIRGQSSAVCTQRYATPGSNLAESYKRWAA